ncbi:MAG TPA: vitamin B12 dependent-methionine synthase activation domain-containing protein, partial [Acidimicrobiales bacterium]|nr:vitamin B12 dependent-methionine synthase activation domain-containing protein [Acidimicrobiales bacterium]
ETMKAAVSYLEPHMEKADQGGKGTVVLATVKGDVHDIGKNLVDIIFTNNGYEVVNLGIKVGIGEMIAAVEEYKADVIGMSGLLVKSTLIMRDNLDELNDRRLEHIPVLLGGAALTRTYVERDLRSAYRGRVFYGRDAFEGLRTMDRLMEIKAGADDPTFGREISEKRVPARSGLTAKPRPVDAPERSPEVATDTPVFTPPFIGSRVAKGIPIDDIAEYLNLTALFRNQWGYRPDKTSGENDAEFKERVSAVLREQLARAKEAGVLVPQVVWGHFPANAKGDDLVIYEDERRDNEIMRFTFPRQAKHPWLCIADFFKSEASGEPDWASFQLVTMGRAVTEEAKRLFAANEYTNYNYLHGLGVEMTEALAEYWHRRIREELGYAGEDGPTLVGLFRQQYRGGRYSWGYPACPDLADNAKVVELLGAQRIGVVVSEEYQLEPEQTTDAIVCSHPAAKYFVA